MKLTKVITEKHSNDISYLIKRAHLLLVLSDSSCDPNGAEYHSYRNAEKHLELALKNLD